MILKLLKGGVSLGTATALQRGLTFLAAALAAAYAGPEHFGAYALAMVMAGTVAGYAGLGAGSVATRYAARYDRQSAAYRKVFRFLAGVTLGGAGVAGLVLLGGARWMASSLLGRPQLSDLISLAAISAFAFLLFELVRGLVLSRLEWKPLLWLSVATGTGVLFLLPAAAAAGPETMVVAHGTGLIAGILFFLVFQGKTIFPARRERSITEPVPSNGELLSFGLVQLGGTIGIGAASWWTAVAITRADPALGQMGFYGVAAQMAGMVAIVPGIFAQLLLPVVAHQEKSGTPPEEAVSASAFLAVSAVVLVGAGMLIGFPLLLSLYGADYGPAASAVAVLVGAAMLQMSGNPAAQFLMLVNLRAVAWINLLWAFILVGLVTLLVPAWGAFGAGLAWLGAHFVSQFLVLVCLARRRSLSPPLLRFTTTGIVASLALLALTLFREAFPAAGIPATGLQIAALLVFLQIFLRDGRRFGHLPGSWRARLSSG